MLILECIGHSLELTLTHLKKVFEPYVIGDYTLITTMKDNSVEVSLHQDEKRIDIQNYQVVEEVAHELAKEKSRLMRQALYNILSRLTGYQPPWGILTGVRPTKLVHQYKAQGMSNDEIKALLEGQYYIKPNKIQLVLEIADKEGAILAMNKKGEANIYIGIPFCPTRCVYCSFTAYDIQKKQDAVEGYLQALFAEIDTIASCHQGKTIRTLYIGGGTPTSLNEVQLEQLLRHIKMRFDLATIEEYTVEAGRPDTLSTHKLSLMKDFGVTRISINPQTMNQKTLDEIGRKHTVQNTIDIFNLARSLGHMNINMDIILGLPGEDVEDVRHTLESLKILRPDSITVHTMAIKRASRLNESNQQELLAKSETIEAMLELCSEYMQAMGLKPYYMYRQKNILGNFENVGYATEDKPCIYNVEIMEEKQSILAAGAGAVTKVVDPNAAKVERLPNLKNLEQYIERIDEMIEKKKEALNS